MLKIAICDDEETVRLEIVKLLQALEGDFELTQFHSGPRLLEAPYDFDVVILDIEMPHMDGMTVSEKLYERQNKPYIIFLTSHTEFMQSAFKVRAFRFLDKPIKSDEFNEAIIEVGKEISSVKRLLICENGIDVWVDIADILYLEAFGDGTYIFTMGGVYTSNKQLRYFSKELGERLFFQTHKSFIVSFWNVKCINNTDVEMLHTSNKVPISRRKLVDFKKAYFCFVRENGRIL